MNKPLDTIGAVHGALLTLSPERVLKTYSGRPGCACGCLGTYSVRSEDPKGTSKVRRKIASMLKALNTWGEDASYMVRPATPGGPIPEGFISIETENRQNTIYFL